MGTGGVDERGVYWDRRSGKEYKYRDRRSGQKMSILGTGGEEGKKDK
jgi:hypothetical protein